MEWCKTKLELGGKYYNFNPLQWPQTTEKNRTLFEGILHKFLQQRQDEDYKPTTVTGNILRTKECAWTYVAPCLFFD